MSIVKMDKITVIGLNNEKDQIIDSLMRMGVVEVVNVEQQGTPEEWEELITQDGDSNAIIQFENELSRIKSSIDYLSKYNITKKKLFAPKRSIDSIQYNEVLDNKDKLWGVVGQIDKYEEILAGLKTEENVHRNQIAALNPWKHLTIPIETTSTKDTRVLLFTVPITVDVEMLKQDIMEQAPESYMETINSDNDQSYILIIYHNTLEDAVIGILKQYGYSRISFKGLKGTVVENIESSENMLISIAKKKEDTSNNIAELAVEADDLQIYHDYLLVQINKKNVLSNIVKTDKTFILNGWLPQADGDRVKNHIQNNWTTFIEVRQAEKDEEHPILLKNNKFVQPFELVTDLFSLPKANGIDPNPFMAPFFFLFFGLMLGDAGYGLIMIIATGIILKKFKIEGTPYKLIKLLYYCGFSTLLWGALFGSWFGDVVKAVSGGAFAIKPIWFNPLDDPMKLLIWSFAFGVIHLFVGMGLKGYLSIREGKIWDAIFDTGLWYVFFLGLIFLLVGGSFGNVGKYMAISGAILLILTQGRSQKNIIKKFTSGLLSLYSSVNFMSDVLSYSRLLALGLATGVVASVINTIGTLFGFNFLGIILFIIVFLVGSVFNMLINVLGAYVHSSRLQYVEFFGKFYEGGGKAYEPFKIKTKYINIVDGRKN